MEIQSKNTVAFYQDIKGNIVSPSVTLQTEGLEEALSVQKTPRFATMKSHFDWEKHEKKGQQHEKEKQS